MTTPVNVNVNPANIPQNNPADVNKEKTQQEGNMGYYPGKPSQGTNLTGYINENNIPSMLQDPESVDDLLDVPSFQRPKITERK
jgi:hypothetical protein